MPASFNICEKFMEVVFYRLLQERLLSFATQLDHRPTIDAARQKFNAWMENSTRYRHAGDCSHLTT